MKEKLDDIKLLNLIKLNIINCFSSKKFKLIFMILLFLPLLQFLPCLIVLIFLFLFCLL